MFGLKHSSFFHSQISFQKARRERLRRNVESETAETFDQSQSRFALVNYFFGGRLRENVFDVGGRFADRRVEVAVADGYDERQMARAQKFERRDQFARAFLINQIGQNHDERTLFRVAGNKAEGAGVARFDQFGFEIVKCFQNRVNMSDTFLRRQKFFHTPTENHQTAIVAAAHRRRHQRERGVNRRVEFRFVADPARHQAVPRRAR